MAASKSRQASDSQSTGRFAGGKPGVRPAAQPAMQSSSEKFGFDSMYRQSPSENPPAGFQQVLHLPQYRVQNSSGKPSVPEPPAPLMPPAPVEPPPPPVPVAPPLPP